MSAPPRGVQSVNEDDFLIDVPASDVPSPYFVKEGRPFCFHGSNSYYLMYKSEFAVKDVLDAAQAMDLGVLRVWAFLDRGSLDESVKNIHQPGHADGVYFHYWDPVAGKPAYNDGPNGLQRIDFILNEARKRDLAITLVLTNNWHDFGGMDQYLQWYGLEKHHEFYTDERVRQAYRDWVHHVVNRVNSINGIPYKEDPTIFSWELANEPRATNETSFDDPNWNAPIIVQWAGEMSAYVKSLDSNHMVSVGDEGFFDGKQDDWAYQAPFGVDSEKLTALPHVDFGTFHLYPDSWGKDLRWGNDFIEDHIAMSRRVDKPVVLEEYGIRIKRKDNDKGPIIRGWKRRQVAYTNWNNIVMKRGGQGAMFWLLSGYEEPGQLYPDYDQLTVYQEDATFQLLQSFAKSVKTDAIACKQAEGADHGPASPFFTARSAPSTQNQLSEASRLNKTPAAQKRTM